MVEEPRHVASLRGIDAEVEVGRFKLPDLKHVPGMRGEYVAVRCLEGLVAPSQGIKKESERCRESGRSSGGMNEG